MEVNYWVYIAYLSSGTFHSIGVTNNLKRRFRLLNLQLDSNEKVKLVHFEEFEQSLLATIREKIWNDLSAKSIHEIVEENNPMFTNLLPTEIEIK